MDDLRYRAALDDDPFLAALKRMEAGVRGTNAKLAKSSFDFGIAKIGVKMLGSAALGVAAFQHLGRAIKEAAKENDALAANVSRFEKRVTKAYAAVGNALYDAFVINPEVRELDRMEARAQRILAMVERQNALTEKYQATKGETEILNADDPYQRDYRQIEQEHARRMREAERLGDGLGPGWRNDAITVENDRFAAAKRRLNREFDERQAKEAQAAADAAAEDAAKRERDRRSELESLDVAARQSEIERMRLSGHEKEARLAELRLRTERAIADVTENQALTANDKYDAVTRLRAEEARTLAVMQAADAREARDKKNDDARRRGVLVGGLAAVSALRQTFGGTDPGNFARQQVVLAQQQKDLLVKIEKKVGGAYLN